MKNWTVEYLTTAGDGRVLQRELAIAAPNSQAALSKCLRLLIETETSWKITQFRLAEVQPEQD